MTRQLKQAILTVVVLLPLAAMARAVPASIGRPVIWSDGSCFLMSYSTMRNGCSTQRSFEIPLVADTAGSKTVVVTALGATPSNNVGCMAIGMNREATLVWGGTRKWLPAFGPAQYIVLTDAYIPNSGYLYANCLVDPGGQINAVDHTA
ncbi:hypothetical protein COCOR_02146 [Corallococcus coralloides DSM 2259]|uniref:Lipoprotein n=1 Tax=Corallococcus coralloides (strain ATCC 25202 / DSM 2259 / NBRC 100086 / M2) TaxID=1144275 RepID=H8MK99_CORCM|nr:hypothetical protein [Corallococcus coralloides]AFE04509.1 hypothetical protein COCOR_02146 [Corallococcus coralloides DSM 2259]